MESWNSRSSCASGHGRKRVVQDALIRCTTQIAEWGLTMPPVAPICFHFGLGDFERFGLIEFWVANEVEASGRPAWLLIADSEGLSVLTGWAAGKFDADKIATTVKTSGVADKVGHKKLVIPGAVSVLSGELEDELGGWEIIVGPREAVDIPAFMKLWKA